MNLVTGLFRFGGIASPWPRRLQRIGQVCELALVNVELFCKVRALRVKRYGTSGPLYLIQLETEAVLPPDVLLEVRCYLGRKMNDVLHTKLTLEDFALVVVRPVGQDAGQIPYVPSRLLAHRLAPFTISAAQIHQDALPGAANDSTAATQPSGQSSNTHAGGLHLHT